MKMIRMTEEKFGEERLSPARRLLKLLHPEGIPWLGATFYNAMSATGIFQSHYEMVARDIMSHCPEGRILDIGTGPGRLLLRLHEQSQKVQLVGLDISPSMVAHARRNVARAGFSDSIDIGEGSASKMPFPNDSFDAVVSTGSIHHWKDPIAGLNEIFRVLKPGCHALVYDIVSDTPKHVLDETAQKFGRLRVMLFWLHAFEEPFLSQRSFELLARSTPFRESHTRFVGVLCCMTLKKDMKGIIH